MRGKDPGDPGGTHYHGPGGLNREPFLDVPGRESRSEPRLCQDLSRDCPVASGEEEKLLPASRASLSGAGRSPSLPATRHPTSSPLAHPFICSSALLPLLPQTCSSTPPSLRSSVCLSFHPPIHIVNRVIVRLENPYTRPFLCSKLSSRQSYEETLLLFPLYRCDGGRETQRG